MKKGIRKRCLAVALSMVLTFMDNVPALAKESGFLENETIVATEEEVRSEDDILNRMTYEEDISTCENETVVQSNVTEESSFAEGTNGSTEEKSNLTEDMKNTDILYWIGTMNSIKSQAEEIVFSELIYV